MQLRLYIRQKKLYNTQLQEIFFDGANALTLQPYIVANTPFPNHRKWRDYGKFIDVTGDISDLFKLKLTWSKEQADAGVQIITDLQQRKAASGVITFEGEAYRLLKQWLIEDVSAPLNAVEVEIRHIGCGNYTDWIIRSTDLRWCEDDICTFDVNLKQPEEALSCVKNTLIIDNHKGWFPQDSKIPNGKLHPRFSYCNEARPNGYLIMLWWVFILLIPVFYIIGIIVALIYNSIVGILVAILSIIRFIVNIVGGDTTDLDNQINKLKNSYIDWKDINDVAEAIFIESSGCGREHPAPLIRDYIQNVCDKCGLTVNAVTAPIFFDQWMNIETSADRDEQSGAKRRWNPHYNACFLGAVSQKGIRRLDRFNFTQGQVFNTTDYWLPQNSPLYTLEQFLDLLKGVYNAEWRVVNNTLYFQRKDYWLDGNYAFDFTKNAPDRLLLLQGICYEWTTEKYPAVIKGLYSADGADTPGNDALHFYNGTVNVGRTDINPNIEGIRDTQLPIGAAKFRLDGAASDYLLDAFQQLSNSSFTSGVVWAGGVVKSINNFIGEYADYALLIMQETTTLPKIIIWDGRGYTNAKAYRPVAAAPTRASLPTPQPNVRYNNYQGTQPWHRRKILDTSVLGNGGIMPDGEYIVTNRVGIGSNIIRYAWLVNYPMYYEPGFKDTLWDWFHWIDDPYLNPALHQHVTVRMELCCETLKRIKPFNDASGIILGQKIAVDNGKYYNEAVITEITVSYDTQDQDGQYIELKGKR